MLTNSRGALGAVFAAVQTLMLSLIGIFRAVDRGADMLEKAAESAHKRQMIRTRVDMRDYAKQYAQEAAQRRAEQNLRIAEYCARSDAHLREYSQAFEELWEIAKAAAEEAESRSAGSQKIA